jgi:2-polyprenyl-3-methyl-5-hydroxy-6-metoxy-1,4-benzoquinol methylase
MNRQSGVNRSRFASLLVVAIVVPLVTSADLTIAATDSAQELLEASGVRGGLVVHLGCGDGQLTAALHASDSYLVQGLDTDPAQVAKAREHLLSSGLYGQVSVRTFDGNRLAECYRR